MPVNEWSLKQIAEGRKCIAFRYMSQQKKSSIICVVQYNIEHLTKHSAKKKLETNDDN